MNGRAYVGPWGALGLLAAAILAWGGWCSVAFQFHQIHPFANAAFVGLSFWPMLRVSGALITLCIQYEPTVRAPSPPTAVVDVVYTVRGTH